MTTSDHAAAGASAAQANSAPGSLGARLLPPEAGRDTSLDVFLEWANQRGFALYPAQEEGLLELWAGRHVVLNTPTGSGKSLVALGLHWHSLCAREVSYYTAPIKALVSEKFFALCDELGAERVGMLTGDASINPTAPVICCTAEVLANLALREGERLAVHTAVLDEFHYYADPERGWAWQVPLLCLPGTQFLLMSATLGNPAPIAERLERRSARAVATVTSAVRPVPLEFEYRETPIHETVQELLDHGRAPVYVVNFTQRECAEQAQSLTSLKLCTREEREAIWAATAGFRFDTAYGKEIKRFIGFGVGVHHAGLLPKYRLLVEQLSQRGLLKAICGTDTLGVGVNIPIRTVLFAKLSKYDGTKNTLLSIRDFKQISGRAGRKGFDDRGWVVCQAPEHVIEKRRRDTKGAKGKPPVKAPPGFVAWDRDTFARLVAQPPEQLESRFRLTHGLVLQLIERDAQLDDPARDNFSSIREIIRLCHESDAVKKRLLAEAAVLVRSLARAGILTTRRDESSSYLWVVVNPDLQVDFSLLHALSLYLVETLALVDPQAPTYALDVLALGEAILENPDVVLRRQVDVQKDQLVAQWKAEGMPYEERMEKLQQITHPKPNAEFIYQTFNTFRGAHPWVGDDNIRPKGIAREMFEAYSSFDDYVRRYGLQRSEGVLLRYLSQVYKVLTQTVPENLKTDEVFDLLGYLRALLTRVDTSLLEEWENLLRPDQAFGAAAPPPRGHQALLAYELLEDPKALRARLRAETHQLLRALARGDWEDAALCVAQPAAEHHAETWSAERFEQALAPFFAEHGALDWSPAARAAHLTRIEEIAPRRFALTHTLLDPAGESPWHLRARVDLTDERRLERLEQPLLELEHVGP